MRAELRETEFPTREYGSVSLPAGRYLALRVVIGQGEGRNWWCVVFPPLCSSACAELPLAASGFSPQELRLVTGEGYALRFKTVELWERLRQRFSVG